MTIFSFRKTAQWCTCIVHATQFNCCGALNFLSLEQCLQQPRAEHTDYKIYGVIQQREYESWVKKIEEFKQRLDEFWQYSIWVKIRFPCFPVLPGSTEAQVISCGTVKSVFWLLTFSAVIANQRWDVFWDTVSFTMLGNLKHYYYFHFFFTVTPGWARSSER